MFKGTQLERDGADLALFDQKCEILKQQISFQAGLRKHYQKLALLSSESITRISNAKESFV